MTALEKLGRYVAESSQPSDPLRDLVELHLIDTVGAWIASTRTSEGANLLRFRAMVCANGRAGEALALDLATRWALALTLAAPAVGHHSTATTSRWFALGNAARNGLTAALAAQHGFSSDHKVIEGQLLPDVFGIKPDISALTDALGERIALSEISF